MWNTGIANAVNLVVASVAIYGLGPVPALGVEGVAAGWVAGQGIAGIFGVWSLARQTRGPSWVSLTRWHVSRVAG